MSLSRPRRGREDEAAGGSGDKGQRESSPGKRPRRCCCSCSCCQETKDFYARQTEILEMEMQRMSKGFMGFIEDCKNQQREMQKFYLNAQLQSMEKICETTEQLIQKQLNTFISEFSTPGDKHLGNFSSLRVIPNQNQTRKYRLKFMNKCFNDKYSRREIIADDGSPIKVAIYDHHNRIVTDGPLSSMQVKIVVLNGEFNNDNKEQWSEDSFHKNIIDRRPGKQPLFSNELFLRLKNGVASLCGAKFQDNSSFVPSKKFRMGVMAFDDSISEKIMEGVSEPFSVKDGRGFSKKKDPRPSLSDPIYKVKKIAENGDRHMLLEQIQIKLVKDFVQFYNKDKDSLRKACKKIPDHDWDIIVEHALSYKPEFDDAQKCLVEASKLKALDNLTVAQHEVKKNSKEHEVIDGDSRCNSLRGSCSNLSLPTLPTKFHDEISQEGTGLKSGPAQESPRPRRLWMKIRIGLMLWKKKPSTESSLGSTDIFAGLEVLTGSEMYASPFTEDSLGMADIFNRSQVMPETGYDVDMCDSPVVDFNCINPVEDLNCSMLW